MASLVIARVVEGFSVLIIHQLIHKFILFNIFVAFKKKRKSWPTLPPIDIKNIIES